MFTRLLIFHMNEWNSSNSSGRYSTTTCFCFMKVRLIIIFILINAHPLQRCAYNPWPIFLVHENIKVWYFSKFDENVLNTIYMCQCTFHIIRIISAFDNTFIYVYFKKFYCKLSMLWEFGNFSLHKH